MKAVYQFFVYFTVRLALEAPEGMYEIVPSSIVPKNI